MKSFDDMFMPKYSWARYGEGYEVTTRGDKRFSSFYAKMGNGKTIEEIYQCDIKGYDSIEKAKGRAPNNKLTRDELKDSFFALWEEWALNNPHLIDELKLQADQNNYLLTDMFATSEINQANALSMVLNRLYG